MRFDSFVAVVAVFGFLLLTVVLGGFAVTASADEVASNTRSVQNETVVVQYDTDLRVRQAGAQAMLDGETVRNATGEKLVEGTDYEYDDGTVRFLNTTNTSAGAPARVSYDYVGRPASTRAVMGIMPTLATGLAYLGLLLAPLGVLAAMLYIGFGIVSGGNARASGGRR
jgi:hypothetical protein